MPDEQAPAPPSQPEPANRARGGSTQASRATTSVRAAEDNVIRPAGSPDAKEKDTDRKAGGAATRQRPGETGRRFSLDKGDLPDHVARVYLAEPAKFGRSIAYYAGQGAEKPAFRDHGDRLATHDSNPDTIRHMVAIAAHRGWSTIEVRGADDFRREVWMEAKALGLEVRGYRPTNRDKEALDRRLEADERGRPPRQPEREPRDSAAEPRPAAGRIDYDRGVAGKLAASGEAPYRNRAGQPPTPFIRIERDNGKALDIWGVTLPEALAKSGAQIGDQVTVRRDGVDRVQRRGRDSNGEATEFRRNRWIIEADRFRQASPAEAAHDPALAGAQSQLAVVATLAKSRLQDPKTQERVVAAAKERIANHIAAGRTFDTARVAEPQKAREPTSRQRSARETEITGPERTRQR